jgi:hypothetical protein
MLQIITAKNNTISISFFKKTRTVIWWQDGTRWGTRLGSSNSTSPYLTLFTSPLILSGMLYSHFQAQKCMQVLHVKCPLFLSDFNQNWNVLINFSETPQYKIYEIPFIGFWVVKYRQISKANRCIFTTSDTGVPKNALFVQRVRINTR